MKARYIRISSKQQSTLRQEVKAHPDEKLYIDIISGSVPFAERPEAKKLLVAIALNQVDSLSVSSIDRLGRNAFDVQKTVELFNRRQLPIYVDNLGICSMVDGKLNNIFKLITDVLSNVAAMERESLLERQREGIAAAKAKNPDTYKGRIAGTVDTPEETLTKHKKLVKVIKNNPTLSLRELAKLATYGDYKVAPNTVRKVKLLLEEKKGAN
jgi:DNA invertase Pin-like site-specific DNA recombinase